jgi:glycine oxidase
MSCKTDPDLQSPGGDPLPHLPKSTLSLRRPAAIPSSIDAAEPRSMPPAVDVAIVGAGIVGLSIGWQLAGRGLSVAIFDRGPAGGGASLAATGMLAAGMELEPGGSDLLPLALDSQRLWPAFRAALEREAGMDIDYREEGTLLVAIGREEVERLRFRYELQQRDRVASRWLSGREARDLEPALRPSVVAGILSPDDHQVDPRRVMAALGRALAAAGGVLIEHCPVTALDMSGGAVAGVETEQGRVRAEIVIIAAGAWSGEGSLLPPGLTVPVRPLKGQSLALRLGSEPPPISHVVWTGEVHLAPKGDGRLVVGATVEERGFDESVTAGGLYALLEGARRALPSIEEMEVEAIWTGLRPTCDDDAPILGATGIDGLMIATGHHRNGVLLAPVTARAMAELVIGGRLPKLAAPFGLGRFGAVGARVRTQEEETA